MSDREYPEIARSDIKPRMFRNWYFLLVMNGYNFSTHVFYSDKMPTPIKGDSIYFGPFWTEQGAQSCADREQAYWDHALWR